VAPEALQDQAGHLTQIVGVFQGSADASLLNVKSSITRYRSDKKTPAWCPGLFTLGQEIS